MFAINRLEVSDGKLHVAGTIAGTPFEESVGLAAAADGTYTVMLFSESGEQPPQ